MQNYKTLEKEKPLFERFTEKAIKVITCSQEEAFILKHSKLYPEHVLLGIIKEGSSVSARFLKASNIKIEELRQKIDESLAIEKKFDLKSSEQVLFSSNIKKFFKQSLSDTEILGVTFISPENLFLSILNSSKNSIIMNIFKEFSINVDKLKKNIFSVATKKESAKSHPENLQTNTFFISKNYSSSIILDEEELTNVFKVANERLSLTGYEILGTEQILQGILEDKDSYLYSLLQEEGVNSEIFQQKLDQVSSRNEEFEKSKIMFTPKAFSVINSAYETAKELGSATIKPEHIMLGVLNQKKGIAYDIIKELVVDTSCLYDKILKPIKKQKPVTLTIIKLAKEETIRLEYSIVGTEQILLGILGEGTSIAAQALKDLGVNLKDARIEVEKLVRYRDDSNKEITFTPRAKKLLEVAWSRARALKQKKIAPEHILFGIISEKECMAMKILENMGVDSLEIKYGVLKLMQNKDSNKSDLDFVSE